MSVAFIAAWALFAWMPHPAQADGDPASDVFFQDNVYYPYQPPVSPVTVADLNKLTGIASSSAHPIKVAVIASPDDLGAVPDLFGKPQQYANLLADEVGSFYTGPVLVVMPAGFGVAGQGLPPNADRVLRQISVDSDADSNTLAQAAVDGVERLSQASGNPLPPVASGLRHGSSAAATALKLAGVVVLFVVLVTGALFLRKRRTHHSTSPSIDHREGP
jgi:hypothetical protein